MRNDISKLVDEVSQTMSFIDIGRGVDDHVLTLSLIPSHSIIGYDSSVSTAHVCANIKARELPDDDEAARAPVDIVVALDVSGSMAGSKLKLCKITLEQLLRMLNPKDRFGLISYDSVAKIVIPAQNMTEKNKTEALKKIAGLSDGSTTNISAAVGLAAQEMRTISNPNPVQSIFLLTDGEANEGICKDDDLVELTKNCVSGDEDASYCMAHDTSPGDIPEVIALQASVVSPITLNCFGYGADHNSTLLSRMAESAMGSYYFVENDSSVITAFGDALGGVFSVVAQNITLTFQVPNEAASMGASVIEVMHKDVIRRENGTYTVTLGDLYAEECRDVLVEVSLAKPAHPSHDPIPHIQVLLSYTDTIRKRLDSQVPKQCFISRPIGVEVSPRNVHVAVQLLRIISARGIEEAEGCAKRDDIPACKQLLKKVRDEVALQAPLLQSDPFVDMILHQVDLIEAGLVGHDAFVQRGHGLFRQTIRNFHMQRCAASNMDEQAANLFVTSKKRSMASKMKSMSGL